MHMVFQDDLHVGKVVQDGAKAAVQWSPIRLYVNFDVTRQYDVRRVAVSTLLKTFVKIKL